MMKSDDSSKSDEPIVVNLDDIKAKSEGSSLTFGEYKELSAKDRTALTEHERQQLAEARKQLVKAAESVSSHYDMTAITSAIQSVYKISPAFQSLQKIDVSPMLKVVADLQKTTLAVQPALNRAFGIQEAMKPAIEAIYKSSIFTQNQFTALAAMQKSIAINYPTENIIAAIKSIQDIFQAPFIARTMFSDFHSAHERIKHGLQIDVGSLRASIEFGNYETVDFAVEDVVTDENSVTATATAQQVSNAGNIGFVDNASMFLAFNDLKQEVRELKQLLTKDSQQGQLLLSPSAVHFQRTSSSIQIGQFKVSVSVSSKQTQFARVLLNSPVSIRKHWDIEEVIFEAFGERIANDEQDWIVKIRSYIHQLNNKIVRYTNNTMPNFFVLDGIEVYVNPEYLNL